MREAIPEDVAKELAEFPPLLASLLFSRGIKTRADAEIFLNPSFERDIHDPFLMKDMERAVERIVRAVGDNEKIIIFGDYDADGIPGAAILTLFFEAVGYRNIVTYIPDRYSEKYGLAEESIRRFVADGAKLLISVDCGITDVYETGIAQSLGVDVIITDHHIPHETLPPAYAVINNKRADDEYPFKYLCGAGTAWKLAQALVRSGKFPLPHDWEKEVLDLAAISTVADMVSLLGENRVIVKEGLKRLAVSERAGLKSLFARTKVNQSTVNEDDIAFMLAPRINISSRMSHGVDALNLLTTSDSLLAATIAKQLEGRNVERRKTVQTIIDSVEMEKIDGEAIIIRGHKDWRIGVLGLTANRLVEKYSRPVCLWTINHEGKLKGSIRSDGTIHVMELFAAMGGAEFFDDFGGHDFSGGFSLLASRISELPKRLYSAYETVPKLARTRDIIFVDAEVKLRDLNLRLWQTIEKLAPFGVDNPKPVFLLKNLELGECREFGNGQTHLEVYLREGWIERKATSFFSSRGDYPEVLFAPGTKVDVLLNLEKSFFRGRTELRLRMVDLRPSSKQYV